MIKVLVVDDSAVIRKIIVGILNKHSNIEVITATNGAEAVEKVQREHPDVVTLDVEMPVMNGLQALQKIMEIAPRPVIMLSALTSEGTKETIQALTMGAVDCIPKINAETVFLRYIETELISRILYFGDKKNYTLYANKKPRINNEHAVRVHRNPAVEGLILIGASTGGPLVLQHIISELSSDLKGTIVIALHMPKGFSSSFAERLQKLCALPVKLAQDKELIEQRTVYICCGGYQTTIEKYDKEYRFHVTEDNGQYPYKPSIDLLFSSVASLHSLTRSTMALILTGMGHDGLSGCTALAQQGVPIFAQDEQSSVVFGMPKAVLHSGIAKELALDNISSYIQEFIHTHGKGI